MVHQLSRWPAIFGLAACVLVATSTQAHAQAIEQSVKAAFLTKFPRYVEWPASARTGTRPIDLCVVGSDPFGRLLNQAARSDPNPIIIHHLVRAEQARSCAIAFLGGTRQQSVGQMVAVLQGAPVLTVTDARHGSSQGMIHFAIHQGKVGFHINDALAARNRLSISSRLLQLALSVRQRGG
ncbi:YfiR family protein [Sphingomonas glaciei]|uniref:YfiR family protein n=1 Tax=Sphingomonas glaciei TaxID=2938948 RepID=A0ABY5MWU2_9SPHN|nr:YfiR family protein [Sphingomonas glaciei]UUR08922.1 YfiR family protein [Sphingomonas glaciei]